MIKYAAAVVGVTLILTGCTKINQENYEKLEMGMSQGDVEDVLGKADTCSRSLGTRSCTWGSEGKKHIKVMFMSNRAVTFSYEGL